MLQVDDYPLWRLTWGTTFSLSWSLLKCQVRMLYDVFRMLAHIMHSGDFWTREQIFRVSKVDVCCEGFLSSCISYKADWSRKVKTSHFHINISDHEITQQYIQQYIPGQGYWPHHLQKSVVLPKGSNVGREIFVPYEVPLHASIVCTWKSPLLWHSSCPSALAEHVHNKHIMWPTFLLEPALPTLWEVTLPPYSRELHPISDYPYGEFLPKSDISTWKEFLGSQNRLIKSPLSI